MTIIGDEDSASKRHRVSPSSGSSQSLIQPLFNLCSSSLFYFTSSSSSSSSSSFYLTSISFLFSIFFNSFFFFLIFSFSSTNPTSLHSLNFNGVNFQLFCSLSNLSEAPLKFSNLQTRHSFDYNPLLNTCNNVIAGTTHPR